MVWLLLLIQEDPLAAGLQYLARHQSPDGSWGLAPEACRCPRPEPPKVAALDDAGRRRVAELIDRLEDRSIEVREEAQREVVRIGPGALPQLREARGSEEALTRCRAAIDELTRPPERADLGVTGLVLLSFLGAGFSHLSRHTVDGIVYGDVVKNGLKWVIAREGEDPLEDRILAALALSEAYGLTGSHLIKDPAQKAIAAIEADDPQESRALIWKGMALKSAELSGLELRLPGRLREIADEVSRRPDRLAQESATFLRIFAERSKAGLEARELPDPATLSDEELHFAALSHFQMIGPGNPWREWYRGLKKHLASRQAPDKDSCTRGSWEGTTRAERMRATAVNSLALEYFWLFCNLGG
jgi:hypothetical protein